MMEMGIDRILFSIDYPFMDNPPGAEWIDLAASSRTRKVTERQPRRLLL
jgi:hypothetical protein